MYQLCKSESEIQIRKIRSSSSRKSIIHIQLFLRLYNDVTNGFANREWNTFSSSFPSLY